VIKVIWGDRWDKLLARDKDGLLLKRMEEALDGDYQNYKVRGGAYTREHFFNKYPEVAAMVANLSDDDIWELNRGGHDPKKVYNAYKRAVETRGQPTVILAKTVKGYGIGEVEGRNTTHQVKKLGTEQMRKFRDRYRIPVPDEKLDEVPFFKPADDSHEIRYLHERRQKLGGYLPSRKPIGKRLEIPAIDLFQPVLAGSEDREMSTTMVFVRLLTLLTRDPELGKRIVPIVPDEARTFGMEGLFRTLGIYSSVGQLYEPVDKGQVMYYREDVKGQILEEGITEAGGMASWIAAATSYANHGEPMIPFYIFYSMFGFQRIGDLAWAGGDLQARGFLLGGTAGRTTLAGEGLQHQDGHSHILGGTIPNCVTYDPAYGYELALIVHDGLRRMYVEQENVHYYLTVMNENYLQPPLPERPGVREGVLRGMYLLQEGDPKARLKVQLLGSGTILRCVLEAARLLEQDFGIASDVWSVTSFNELRREGLDAERWNMLNPQAEPRSTWVAKCLADRRGPAIAATDYVKLYADQIRRWVPMPYKVLGTDGFGRSDRRQKLRHFFEVDERFVAVAALEALADAGEIPAAKVAEAIARYGIDVKKPNPVTV
jgi:pyruvate dehydrogenase E1 component